MAQTWLTAGLISLLVSTLLARAMVKLMSSREIGQYIRSWGPKVHEHKSGTPTMGGLAILGGLGAALLFLWFCFPGGRSHLILFALGTFGFGAVGLADDLLSMVKGKAKGLSPREKILIQLAVGLLLVYLTFRLLDRPNTLLLPFTSASLDLPPTLYYLLTVFILLGVVNSVNLTDGLDGLAGGASIMTVLAFCLTGGSLEAPFFASLVGATLGFLWYNSYPADLFMGDSGAFALGGFLGAAGMVTRGEFFLPLFGGLFVLESLSVILQVSYYRLRGKRIFKISPLHHHFESAEGIDYEYLLPELTWEEPKITARLLIIHLGLAGVGLVGYFGWLP